MKELITIVIILLLVSCGPAAKLRRAEKLISKAEALGATWKSDTVFIEKTVIVPEIHTDSLVVVKLGDTVTIEKERVKVKLVKMRGDTVFVDVKVPSDTIKVNVPTIINREITAKGWLRWWHLGLAFLIGAIVGRFVIRLLI